MNNNKVVLYTAVSLDGYIAREDGSVDWLMDVEGDGGDNGYTDFYNTVGTVVMGKNTYLEVLKLSDTFPYAGKPAYVYSNSPLPDDQNITVTNEEASLLIPRLQAVSQGDVWLVGGGLLTQTFMEQDLIDEMQLAFIPKVLGEGIPLFPKGTASRVFRLKESKHSGQILLTTYERV